MAALRDGEQDAATVTPRISWDLRYDHWDDVHPVQKLFATGEAIAHLEYLEAIGTAVRSRGTDAFCTGSRPNPDQNEQVHVSTLMRTLALD